MRVSTRGAYLNSLLAMQKLQQALDYTQRQISSGRRILTPSDDPIAASRSIQMVETISRLEQFDRNSTLALNRLSQEESALNSVNNVVQRVRELGLQANNATQSDESRGLIAVEMRELLDELVQLANQQDGNGRYIFSGNLDQTRPVSRSGSTFTYHGDQSQRIIQIGEGRQVADGHPGSRVFFEIRNGNGIFQISPAASNLGTGLSGEGSVVDPTAYDRDTYTFTMLTDTTYQVVDSSGGVVDSGTYETGDTITFSGIEFSITGQPVSGDEFTVAPSQNQDIFSIVDQLSTALEQSITDDASRAALNNAVNSGLLGLDQALGKVLDIRTEIGSRLAAIDNQVNLNANTILGLQTALSDLQDLDYAEAVSRLSAEAATLEAAQASFVRTQQLSLFNYF
ncbi:MAG: flagellar hook-associated protein FlgL [Pseudomonadota bacterium]